MSLVLEALRKLDREKGRDERGFVVMAAAPWPTRTARRWPRWVALGTVAAAAVAGALVLLRPSRPPLAPAVVPAPPAVPAAAPTPAATALPLRVAPLPARGATPRPTKAGLAPVPAPADAPAAAAPTPAPVAAVPPPDHTLRLQAISARDGQPIAIVNDHLVRVGDEFDGVRILAIRGMEVDVEVHGLRTTLRF